MYAVARNLRISYKKANLVAGLVRRKNAVLAIATLENTPKKASSMIAKVIASAVANATNNFNQDKENLYIKEIIVNEGMTLKRSVPISRGRMHPINKRTCHITVKLESKTEEKVEPKQEANSSITKESKEEVIEKEVKTTKNTSKKT